MDNIAQKYLILKTLGVGAMGEVYLVMPPKGDAVALKLLKTLDEELSKNAIQQFENEFQVLKRLSHPNIETIIDYGFDEELKKVYITLPWLKGRDIYESTKDLSFEECEEYFVQMFRALNYLHQKELIHCDLKPRNIIIEDGRLILIDFGLTGYWGEELVGTPPYLAPELFRGEHHNTSTDLYAAGVVCYNCLARFHPFYGESIKEVYSKHRRFTPPLLSDVRKDVPRYFSDIIATLLNKKADERYPSAALVIEEIGTYSHKSYSIETKETLLSYLPTRDEHIGRPKAVLDMKIALSKCTSKINKDLFHLMLIHGQKNVGKTRFITKIKSELQLAKYDVESVMPPLSELDIKTILRANAVIVDNLHDYYQDNTPTNILNNIIRTLEKKILHTTNKRFVLVVTSKNESCFNDIKKMFPLEETSTTTIELLPFTREETKEFLINIIGEKEIPNEFIEQFYFNTQGLPGIAMDLIQVMIDKGLLFDKTGRWTDDLLLQLKDSVNRLEIPETIEQEFEKIYDSLTPNEEDIVKWLCLCPHPLTLDNLQNLTHQEGLNNTLDIMIQKQIIRTENDAYKLYRNIFQNFIRKNLPDKEIKNRHTLLAFKEIGLINKWRVYHLSLGSDSEARIRASERLCQIYQNEGRREDVLHTYLKLIKNHKDVEYQRYLDWYIKAANLMIELDRFDEAIQFITKIEDQIYRDKPGIDHNRFMVLLEKKGMALLHLQKHKMARIYFKKGLAYSKRFKDCIVQQIRFENNLATLDYIMGYHDRAVEIFKKNRAHAKQLTQSQLCEITNNNLGHVYIERKEYQLGIPYLIEDIKVFSHLKNKEPLTRAVYAYAEALKEEGEVETAAQTFKECVDICRSANLHLMLLRSYNGLGSLYQFQQQNNQALENYQNAIEIAVRQKDDMAKAILLFNQANILIENENMPLASRRLLMSKQLLENKKTDLLAYEKLILSECYDQLSYIALNTNNTMQALNYQLDRQKLVSSSESLKHVQFEVSCHLAELYKRNCLDHLTEEEFNKLESLAATDVELKKLKELKRECQEIEIKIEREITVRITKMED